MPNHSHSSLNQQQIAQVNYLFADSLFGTSAEEYLYELDKSGMVKGRVINQKITNTARANMRVPVNITAVLEVNATEEIMKRANISMDALAALVAQKLYQRQFEEAHHE